MIESKFLDKQLPLVRKLAEEDNPLIDELVRVAGNDSVINSELGLAVQHFERFPTPFFLSIFSLGDDRLELALHFARRLELLLPIHR